MSDVPPGKPILTPLRYPSNTTLRDPQDTLETSYRHNFDTKFLHLNAYDAKKFFVVGPNGNLHILLLRMTQGVGDDSQATCRH